MAMKLEKNVVADHVSNCIKLFLHVEGISAISKIYEFTFPKFSRHNFWIFVFFLIYTIRFLNITHGGSQVKYEAKNCTVFFFFVINVLGFFNLTSYEEAGSGEQTSITLP